VGDASVGAASVGVSVGIGVGVSEGMDVGVGVSVGRGVGVGMSVGVKSGRGVLVGVGVAIGARTNSVPAEQLMLISVKIAISMIGNFIFCNIFLYFRSIKKNHPGELKSTVTGMILDTCAPPPSTTYKFQTPVSYLGGSKVTLANLMVPSNPFRLQKSKQLSPLT